jgi:hypothetical protein
VVGRNLPIIASTLKMASLLSATAAGAANAIVIDAGDGPGETAWFKGRVFNDIWIASVSACQMMPNSMTGVRAADLPSWIVVDRIGAGHTQNVELMVALGNHQFNTFRRLDPPAPRENGRQDQSAGVSKSVAIAPSPIIS